MRKLSIWKSGSLRSKRFRVVWEQRTRNESQRLREKMALVPFLARPKPKIMLPGLCLLRNPKQTLATQATCLVSDVIAHFRLFATESRLVFRRLLFQYVLGGRGGGVAKGHEQTNKTKLNNNCSKRKKS